MNIWPKPEDFDQQGLLKSGQSPPNTASESEDSEEHIADFIVKRVTSVTRIAGQSLLTLAGYSPDLVRIKLF